jgi:DNA-binding beta-propeller fold protein YncE
MKRFLAVLLGVVGLAWPASALAHSEGAVYTLSNSSHGNAVIVFHRGPGGQLHRDRSFPTNGRGTGSNLGSQGAVALSPDGRRLYAVNAASNTISVFRTSGAWLHRIQVIRSGGELPISVTARGRHVYVLNAGPSPSVVGFRVTHSGIGRIHGAWRRLATVDSGPAQVDVNPAGTVAVVTNKTSNTIDTFRITPDGALGHATSHPSVGGTPFGFAFTRSGTLVVSDASIPPSSGATAYAVSASGALTPRSGAVENHQQASCWVAVTPDGRFAYTANAASGTLSGYRVHPGGSITLLDTGGGTASLGAGSHPLDEAVTPGGSFLYVLADGFGRLEALRIGSDGSLHHIGGLGGLPSGTVGIAAR